MPGAGVSRLADHFCFVNVSFVFFRSKSLDSAKQMLVGMVGLNGVMLDKSLKEFTLLRELVSPLASGWRDQAYSLFLAIDGHEQSERIYLFSVLGTPMNFRKSVLGFLIALSIFIAFNFIVWKLFTEHLLTTRYGTGGDLSRLGYTIDSKQARRAVVDLPRKHIMFNKYNGQPVDMITIGDSFSNGGGEGRNSFYQDYIATYNNITVLNLAIYNTRPLETALMLANSGLLDKLKPRFLLIESVERFCFERFSGETDFNVTEDEKKLVALYKKESYPFGYLPKTGFINNANFKYLYYRFLYLFSDNPTKKVVTKKLERPFFNVKNADMLLFYKEDVNEIPKLNKQTIKALNDNMNRLAEVLAKKNIKLYFMPVVDKYNLYSEFILNNPYNKSVFFEEMRLLPKNYEYIDTKNILLNAIRQGEKDIYYADDTHWSWRASELIFNQVRIK